LYLYLIISSWRATAASATASRWWTGSGSCSRRRTRTDCRSRWSCGCIRACRTIRRPCCCWSCRWIVSSRSRGWSYIGWSCCWSCVWPRVSSTSCCGT